MHVKVPSLIHISRDHAPHALQGRVVPKSSYTPARAIDPVTNFRALRRR